MSRLPTDNAIVDVFHELADLHGYSPENIPHVAAALTRATADEDERGAVLAACQRVWRERFEVMGT